MKNFQLSLSARAALAALFFVPWIALQAAAQTTAAAPEQPPAQAAAPAATDEVKPAETPATPPVDRTHRSLSQNVDEAWSILKTAAADPKKPDVRVQAVAAIGTIEESPVAHKLVGDALSDSSLDVRTAAIMAVGTLKDKGLEGQLREMLSDKEPQIAFTAATTLWKMGDKSGEDILMAVTEGDRKTDAGLVKGSERAANKDMHNPAKLAEIGARQGAGYLLGPFGIGITAWDYAHKHDGEDPRVTAITLLSEDKTENVRATLVSALADKDPQVRAAAARALGDYRTRATATALLVTFDDGKMPVRLLGSAAYIRINSHAPSHHLLHR